jgi:hypothetical protein
MDAELRKKLVRQRAVAKASLTRLQNFLETGDCKLHDLQVRYADLSNLLTKFENAQIELEAANDDHVNERESYLKSNITT